MNETDYNARLYEKMKAEQDKYRDWLVRQEPSEILNHTYEYTMREDIVMCMEELELEPEKARALLRSPCPLSDVYKEFRDRETEHTQNIGKSFLKSYASVCLEGAIIVLACIIFSVFASSPPVVDPNAAPASMVWSYIGELIFNMLILVGAVKMADRLVKEMMGI